MHLHQFRKLAVLSLAKKDPEGASFLQGTFLKGKSWGKENSEEKLPELLPKMAYLPVPLLTNLT